MEFRLFSLSVSIEFCESESDSTDFPPVEEDDPVLMAARARSGLEMGEPVPSTLPRPESDLLPPLLLLLETRIGAFTPPPPEKTCFNAKLQHYVFIINVYETI
jgi:hypothetical protein